MTKPKNTLALIGIILFCFLAKAAPETLIGTWKGYCNPVGSTESRICSYNFLFDGKGSYSCDFYSDLRCEKSSNRKTTHNFSFQTDNKGNTKINFPTDGDFEEQITKFVIKGDLLTENGISVRNRGEPKSYPSSASSPDHYTRVP